MSVDSDTDRKASADSEVPLKNCEVGEIDFSLSADRDDKYFILVDWFAFFDLHKECTLDVGGRDERSKG